MSVLSDLQLHVTDKVLDQSRGRLCDISNIWMNEWIRKLNIAPIRQTSEALATEQMSFEFLSECLGGQWWSPKFDGEAVPRGRARHGEVSLTDRSPCTRHDECPAVSRPQLPPADAYALIIWTVFYVLLITLLDSCLMCQLDFYVETLYMTPCCMP